MSGNENNLDKKPNIKKQPQVVFRVFGALAIATMACDAVIPNGAKALEGVPSATASRTSTSTDTRTATSTSSPTATSTPDIKATMVDFGTQFARTAEAKPTATPTRTPTSSPKPSETASPTATSKPTQQVGEVSAYEAGANDVGVQQDGILGAIDLNRYKRYLLNFEDQFKLFPDDASLQNYAQAMQESPLKDLNGDGKVDLPADRYADFWVDQGGLGFDSSVHAMQGVTETVQTLPKDFFTFGQDGYGRARIFLSEKDLGKGFVQAARMAVANKLNFDFTKFGPNTALAQYDGLIRQMVIKAITENGLKTSDLINWPGAADLLDADQILNSNVTVKVGYRPKAGTRPEQKLEEFRCLTYKDKLEQKSETDDENFTIQDSGTAVQILVTFNPNNPDLTQSLRFDVLNEGAPQDPLRPELSQNLSTILDSKEVYLQVEEGRWVKPDCEKASVVAPTSVPVAPTAQETPKENPIVTPVNPTATQPGATETPHQPTQTPIKPTETPVPTASPRPTDTPEPTVTPAPTQPPQPTVTVGATETGSVATPSITPEPHNTPVATVNTPLPAASNTPVTFP